MKKAMRRPEWIIEILRWKRIRQRVSRWRSSAMRRASAS